MTAAPRRTAPRGKKTLRVTFLGFLLVGEDFGLRLAGLAAAASSATFAALMIASGSREPRINGMEHFAIFAKPAATRMARPVEDPGVDPIVTGGIGPAPRARIETPPTGPRLDGYRLIGVVDNQAIVLSAGAFRKLRVGETLAEGRTVARIGRVDMGFVVVMSDGSFIASAPAQADGAAEATPAAP